MKAALTRYRVMSYIVGTLLVLLFFVAMPLKYAGANDSLVAIIGPVHGFLYVFYLIAAFDVARRAGWPLKQTLLVLIAGTVPVVSFVAERWVHRQIAPKLAAEAA
ncbi:DUF3817 domain-containing protein [Phytomonospora endophytica]|uniref:Integral membrane protein n=1 Tax=Phytomonospora endophytica TaxID=714109 RepID=A0A841FH06_9ACTN|nr:DUF3817 domain-containing protein [Phytomonospora endophytica]MBB6034985.1 integral membrane protein [Phytomonospora endophytica]GIG71426.1 membrane protein [Phytomonospora endophytica]